MVPLHDLVLDDMGNVSIGNDLIVIEWNISIIIIFQLLPTKDEDCPISFHHSIHFTLSISSILLNFFHLYFSLILIILLF